MIECPSLGAFNAMGNLVGSPPIIINEIVLTLEHVMEKLDAIEKKMLTEEHIENLDKRMHNIANKIGSKAGDVLKLLFIRVHMEPCSPYTTAGCC